MIKSSGLRAAGIGTHFSKAINIKLPYNIMCLLFQGISGTTPLNLVFVHNINNSKLFIEQHTKIAVLKFCLNIRCFRFFFHFNTGGILFDSFRVTL